MNNNKNVGLTLIELLAVISIISILFILLIPQINNAIQKSKETGVLTDFKSYQNSITSYFIENKNKEIIISDVNKYLDENLKSINGLSKEKNPYGFKYEISNDGKSRVYVISNDDKGTKEILIVENTINGIDYKLIGFSTGENTYKIEKENDYYYYIVENEAIIINYKGNDKDVVVPQKLGGADVTTIGFSSFQNKNLTSVVLPSTLKKIEHKAFNNNKISSVVFPNDLEFIGPASFQLNKLTSVSFPSNVKYIGIWAFANNEINSYSFPTNFNKIPDGVFAFNKITNLNIPSHISSIGVQSFYQNNLVSVTIPSSLISIDMSAFGGNSNNPIFAVSSSNMNLKNGLNGYGVYSKDGKTIFEGTYSVLGTSDFNSVTNIADGAFLFKNLTSITIPDSVVSIGKDALNNNKLSNIIIPSSVKYIGENSFFNNPNLKTVINKSLLSNDAVLIKFNSSPSITN